MTIVIFGNTFKRDTITEVAHILQFMQEHNVRVILSRELRDEMNLREQYEPFSPDMQDEIDFAISVGGDGTFLYTSSQVGDMDVPILGVNCGHLGFLAEVQTNEVDKICKQLIANDYTIEQRAMLQLTPSEGTLTLQRALNEVAVMKQELSSMIHVDAYVNGSLLHSYRADGLVIATPTGSTAYNLSVGGPLMAPQVKSFIISPIATHSLNVRPLVIPDDWTIDLKIRSRSGSYLVSVDGRSQTVKDEITLHLEKAKQTIKFVQLGNHTFFDALHEKLLWGK